MTAHMSSGYTKAITRLKKKLKKKHVAYVESGGEEKKRSISDEHHGRHPRGIQTVQAD